MKTQKKLSIVTGNLFTHDGKKVVLGGLERYTRDIAFLCRDLGFDVTIHQFGNGYWTKRYDGIPVKAYPWNGNSERCVEVMMNQDLSKADHVIYMWLGFQTKYKPNSVTINHGVWFDEPGKNGQWGPQVAKTHVIPALEQTKAVVSVDLNFLNYTRCTIPQADNNKMQYIPNYVDTDKFYPKNVVKKDNMIEILYPRRYDKYRGIYLMQEIAPQLLDEYDNITFNFAIDENHDNLIAEWKTWLNKQPHKDRIKWKHYPMDEMPEAYANADIVVIPTICSEGTSLSALEAMAMEKPIVSTNIGGLSNLILPEVNGKIVNPTAEDVKNALKEYIENPKQRKEHAKRAHDIANIAFSKKQWDKAWKEVILSNFQ